MKRFALLFLVLMLALAGLACNVGGSGDDDQADSSQTDTTETDQGDADQDDDADSSSTAADEQDEPQDQPSESGSDEGAPADDTGTDGMFANPDELDSYRSRTTMTLQEGQGLGIGTTELEWVRENQARHTTMLGEDGSVMLETINIGDETWMDMGDGNWIYVPATGSAGINPADYQTSMEDILEDFEGGLDPDGSETIDGIKCKRYNIDTDFSIELPMPEEANPLLPMAMEGHVEGQIWIADEGNLPAVIVRSDTTQQITIKYESREETMVYEELRELYDINEPITIEPPEGASAMELPTPPEEGLPEVSAPSEDAEAVETANLDALDSYRLEWYTQMASGESGMEMNFLEEWSGEQNALRVVISMGENQAGEYIWVDDQVWINIGGTWVQTTDEDASSMMEGRGDLFAVNNDMVYVADEMMNGVNCKHYVLDMAAGGMTTHQEVWVANESGLPPVVVRAVLTMDTAGMVSQLEGNVTDINQPIDIELPNQ